MDGRVTRNLRGRWRWRAAVLVAMAAVFAAQALWAADSKIKFDIPAGDFSRAIIEFYKQTKVEILYASAVSVGELKTREVIGDFAVSEALSRMLEGTGFTFEFENPNSVLLKREPPSSVLAAMAPGLESTPHESASTQFLAEGDPDLKDIVVTGSLIRGVLDIMSPLVRVEKKQMKSSAFATVWDALQALPINSGAAPSEDYDGAEGNFNRGSAPNLRGLGYGATLVLVNGHRQPAAGSAADFVDISSIPLSAVERIEVLPDGTSAIYGSDAIAGVVNIIMRDDFHGAETQARFATTPSGVRETVVSQLVGDRWDTGKWMLAYQYSEKDALSAADQVYTANADKTSLGGTDHRDFWGNPGNILNFARAPLSAIPQGQDGTSLDPTDLLQGVTNLHNSFEHLDLTPSRRLHGLYLSGSQMLRDRLELFGEARFSKRESMQLLRDVQQPLLVPSSNPYFVDAYGGAPFVLVAYNFNADLGTPFTDGKTLTSLSTLGLKLDLGYSWKANLSASYGREDMHWAQHNVLNLDALEDALGDSRPRAAFNPFGDGSHTNISALRRIRATDASNSESSLSTAGLLADGDLFSLPSGTARLAIGVEHRQEDLHHHLAGAVGPARYGRDISSVFSELSVPLIGKPHALRAIPRLELSLAARYEEYSDFGDTFNPKIGLRWAPAEWLKVRTSWGTSFKAPKLLDLYDTSQNAVGMAFLPDPGSPAHQSLVFLLQGNSADLNEETATAKTIGLDFVPTRIPNLGISLTYYAITYQDRILRPGPPSPFDILRQESQWSAVINRRPTQQQINDICSSPDFFEPPPNCEAIAPAAIVDFRLKNLAWTRTRGMDLTADYSVQTRRGSLDLGFTANYVLDFEQAFTRTSPAINLVDTVGNPPALRARSVLEWNQHGRDLPGYGIAVALDFTGSYKDIESILNRKVGPSKLLNLRLSYRTSRRGSWLDDVEVALNAVNVFNEAPPFVDRDFGYDRLNSDPFGRVISLHTQKSW